MNAVALPWPSKLLSPNARVHHMMKHKAVRSHRSIAAMLGSQAHWKPLRIPVCAVLPITPTKRRRDIDNVLAGLKAAFDGLTDAKWWSDDSDIVSISIRKPLYLKSWARDPIILVADEECNEDVMLARIRKFSELAVSDPESAWESLSH